VIRGRALGLPCRLGRCWAEGGDHGHGGKENSHSSLHKVLAGDLYANKDMLTSRQG
jgi:hypothetical protein